MNGESWENFHSNLFLEWFEFKNFPNENSPAPRYFIIDIFLRFSLRTIRNERHLRRTYLWKEFQQTKNDERHRRSDWQAELHDGKVDAYVTSADVDVRQKNDERYGWL